MKKLYDQDADRFPKRKNPRLKEYDYAASNYYFITICTDQKKCIFGRPLDLNLMGKYAEEGLRQIPSHFPGVKVDKYVVMPNHVHAILVLTGNRVNLSTVVCSYKSYVTKKVHEHRREMKVWQTSFHDHVIRNQQAYEKIWLYIDGNPQKWEEDCFFTE